MDNKESCFDGCLSEDDLEKIVLQRRDFKKTADFVFMGAVALLSRAYITSDTPLAEDYTHNEKYLKVLEILANFVNDYGRLQNHSATLKMARCSLEFYSQIYSRIKSLE